MGKTKEKIDQLERKIKKYEKKLSEMMKE